MIKQHWSWLSLTLGIATVAVACAGNLDNPDQFTTGGSSGSATAGSGGTASGAAGTGGSSGATSTGGAAGTGGSGGGTAFTVPACVASTTAFKSCQVAGCHTGTPVSAGLKLDAASLAVPANFKDIAGKGTDGASAPDQSCMGIGKLVDSAAPEMSLIYTKITAKTCGAKMPVIGTINATQTACVLEYVKAVAAAQ